MKITIKTFGPLTEILEREFDGEAPDTDSLMAGLYQKHEALRGRKLLLAVNSAVIRENTLLEENDVVAIMPPYSGG